MRNPRVTRSRWPRTRRHLGSRAVPSQGRDTWLAQTFRLPGKAKRSGPCENHMGNKPPFPRTLLRDRSGRRDFSSRCLRLPLLLAAPSQNRRGRRLKFPAGSVVRLSPSQVACGGTTEASTQRGLGIRHRDLFPRERVYVVESTRGGEEARAPAWALAPGAVPGGRHAPAGRAGLRKPGAGFPRAARTPEVCGGEFRVPGKETPGRHVRSALTGSRASPAFLPRRRG